MLAERLNRLGDGGVDPAEVALIIEVADGTATPPVGVWPENTGIK